MSFRPFQANWFEAITIRKQLAQTIALLASTGAVELESRGEDSSEPAVPNLDAALKDWRELARKYRMYWPAPRFSAFSEEPTSILARALSALAAWRSEADPVISRLEQLSTDRKALVELSQAISATAGELPPLGLIAQSGARICAWLFRFPHETARTLPPVLIREIAAAEGIYVLVVGRPGSLRDSEALLAGLKGTRIVFPRWLPDTPQAALEEISRRDVALKSEITELEEKLADLSGRSGVAAALGTIELMQWLSEQARSLNASKRLVWVTGWTADEDGAALEKATQESGVSALVHVTEAPQGREAPVLMKNPPWVRSFEIFVRLLGTPTMSEADPSQLLAVIAPLLFGFMFGDVGQGLVLAITGFILQRRIPYLRMLIPGGLMAAVFGVLFGSIFAREDIIPALWVHPISQPVLLLKITLGAGAAILSLGLVLDAIQAQWRGEGLHWLSSRGGLATAYVGLLLSPLTATSLWLCAAGAAWFVLGAALEVPAAWLTGFLTGAAKFLEQSMQLAMNTISFTRVGAFALAHAGLSSAIIAIADSAGTLGSVIVLALGNMLILALEGLVVAIQTTRLILFEFFIRFLKGGGREFKPLAPPNLAGWGCLERHQISVSSS
jgi:V/A-type H+-transporting ATPase subunit I